MDKQKNNQFLMVMFLVILISIAQLGSTLCLPALNNIALYYKTSLTVTQLAISFYTIGIGVSQFFYGIFSDKFGRKPICMIGIFIFLIGDVISIFSPTNNLFLISRLIQGAGMGVSGVINRAIICETFEKKERAKYFSLISSLITVVPLISPILGGYLNQYFHWRSGFIFLTSYAFLFSILWISFFKETNNKKSEDKITVNYFYTMYFSIFKNDIFIIGLLCSSLIYTCEIIIISISPYIFQHCFSLSSQQFGETFSIIILAFMVGSYFSSKAVNYLSLEKIVMLAIFFLMMDLCLFNYLSVNNFISIYSVCLIFVFFMFFSGFIYPNTTSLIMDFNMEKIGSSGAVIGGVQALFSGVTGVLIVRISHSFFIISLSLLVLVLVSLIFFIVFIQKSTRKSVLNLILTFR